MQINRVYLESVDSTNNWAKRNAKELDREALTVILAEGQTAGRGRFDRSWVSPTGVNLYVTYVFFIRKIDQKVGNIPQILALAVHDALSVYKVKIKWPNDIMLAGKKLGGILCEVIEAGNQWAVIVGLGVNINMEKSMLDTIDRPATSLLEALQHPQDKETIGKEIDDRFHRYLEIFQEEGFAPFYSRFIEALIHKQGDPLLFSNFDSVVKGSFEAVHEDGSLVLIFPDGSKNHLTSGELV